MSTHSIDNIKNQLHRAAFLVAQPGKAEEAHSQILDCILELEQFSHESGDKQADTALHKQSHNKKAADELEEISKVERRLKLWSKRPSQINTQILVAFLKAKREGIQQITESDIHSRVADKASFDTNFAQMKIIAEKNHGKIFEQMGDQVVIWEPIKSFVEKFENNVFQNNN